MLECIRVMTVFLFLSLGNGSIVVKKIMIGLSYSDGVRTFLRFNRLRLSSGACGLAFPYRLIDLGWHPCALTVAINAGEMLDDNQYLQS